MKLYLKKNKSDVSTRFVIYDDCDSLKYKVSGCKKTFCERMVVTTPEGIPLVTIRMTQMGFACTFHIKDSRERFLMTVSGHIQNPSYRFHGISWSLKRELLGRSFEIVDADNSVVMIQNANHFLTKGYYELQINKESRELFCVATAVCADILNYVDAASPASV